jgi:hypothetical protein
LSRQGHYLQTRKAHRCGEKQRLFAASSGTFDLSATANRHCSVEQQRVRTPWLSSRRGLSHERHWQRPVGGEGVACARQADPCSHRLAWYGVPVTADSEISRGHVTVAMAFTYGYLRLRGHCLKLTAVTGGDGCLFMRRLYIQIHSPGEPSSRRCVIQYRQTPAMARQIHGPRLDFEY